MPTDPDARRPARTLDELTAAMHAFVAEKGWYAAESPHQQSPRNIATSLVIEAAEVLEHFQWNEDVEDPTALAEELADVALYLMQLASLAEIDLQDAIVNKLAANYDRSWD